MIRKYILGPQVIILLKTKAKTKKTKKSNESQGECIKEPFLSAQFEGNIQYGLSTTLPRPCLHRIST